MSLKKLALQILTLLGLGTLLSVPALARIIPDAADLPRITCADGESLSISLVNYEKSPDAEVLSKVFGKKVYHSWSVSYGSGLRIDACVDNNDQAHIERVVVSLQPTMPISMFSKAEKTIVDSVGLTEAFQGDYQNLKILVRNTDEPNDDGAPSSDFGLLIKGFLFDGQSLVGIVPVALKGNGSTPAVWSGALIGTFEIADSFSGKTCQPGHFETTSKFQLGTAQFEAEICGFAGGGETTGYVIKSMSVVDTALSIPANVRGLKQEFSGDELAKVLRYNWNHHNACDSFVLKVDAYKAVYAASSSPTAGCGEQVEGAPVRSYDDKWGETFFTLTYDGQTTPVQILKAGHYLKLY